MELEVDSKQILRNHHTSLPSPLRLMKSLLVLEGGGRVLQTGKKNCISVGGYCVFNTMPARILAINTTASDKAQAQVLSSCSQCLDVVDYFRLRQSFR